MTNAFLPNLVEDELVFGWLARHRHYIGSPNAARHTELLFGSRSAVVSPLLQGRLADLCKCVDLAEDAPVHLLQRHSLFPYFTAFQEPQTINTAMTDLVEDGGAKAFMKLGIAAFCVTSDRASLRHCPHCHAEHLAAVGVPTWLRSHQLPGNLVCPEHGAPLVSIPLNGKGRHEFMLPPIEAPAGIAPSWSDTQHDLLLEIARRQAELLKHESVGREIEDWCPFYRDLLSTCGLMRSASKVDQPALREAVAQVLGDVLPLLPHPCRNIDEGGWPTLLVRKHRKAVHPLLHVLLSLVVERTPKPTSLKPLTSSPPRRIKAGSLSRKKRKVAPRTNWEALDREALTRIRHTCKCLLRVTPPRRLTFTLIEHEAFSPGWLQKRRTQLPQSYALAKASAEDSATFLDRRLAYWSSALVDAPDWEICRAAGLRHQRWPEAKSRLLHLRSMGSLGSLVA
jgi:hypothetical protein